MKIIHYPHPTLRYVSKPVRRVDAALRAQIREMFELMYEAQGIGLAANQVDLPLRFFICNLAGKPDEGEEMVFLNPVLSRPKGSSEREEGCLSIPGVYAPVMRPETVHLEAFALDGSSISADLDDMLARVVQHEIDHLDGVLFTDRLSATQEMEMIGPLQEFELEFKNLRESGEMPSDHAIMARLSEIEKNYAV